jgi:hypothetical protein
MIRTRPTRGLGTAILILLWAGPGASQVKASDSPQSTAGASIPEPPPGPRPIQVHLGLTIIDFARINSRDETFDVHGYLEITGQMPPPTYQMAATTSLSLTSVRRRVS